MASAKRGKLIVFEGLDRSGKSTQCEKLVETLRNQGEKTRYMRFPDRTTTIGKMISSYLQSESQLEDHVIHLLFSANRWEAAHKIEEHINVGTTVVIDRYYYSGCVYSAAKRNPSLSIEWARHPEVGLPRPDLCLFLDISAEEAAKRGSFGTERYERQELQDRVRHLFGEMKAHADEKEDLVTIDASGPVDDVERSILMAVAPIMKQVDEQGQPMRRVQPW